MPAKELRLQRLISAALAFLPRVSLAPSVVPSLASLALSRTSHALLFQRRLWHSHLLLPALLLKSSTFPRNLVSFLQITALLELGVMSLKKAYGRKIDRTSILGQVSLLSLTASESPFKYAWHLQ